MPDKPYDERTHQAAIDFFTEIAVRFGDLEAFMFAAFEIGDREERSTEEPVLIYGAYAAGLKAFGDLLRGYALVVSQSREAEVA